MEFTWKEKKAICSYLWDMMVADGKITGHEGLYFKKVQVSLGLTDDEFTEFHESKERDQRIVTITNMNQDKRLIFAKLLVEMMMVDGKVEESEARVLAIVSLTFGMDKEIKAAMLTLIK